ncbi:very short patch repair endonuclease [Rhizobium leguminosarum]
MNDIVSPETRSRMMSGIRGKNTSPELLVRRLLHRMGFRFRLHLKDLPGKPDIVLPKHRAVIFVNGCFWHRHPGCKYATTPTSNKEFWEAKFAANTSRDATNYEALARSGWRVAIVWECATRTSEERNIEEELGNWITCGDTTLEVPKVVDGQSPAFSNLPSATTDEPR